METSILTARILGVVYLAFGIGVLLNWENYKKAILDLLDNAGYMVIVGFLAAGLGVTILSIHNVWVGTWHTLVTIIGWIATIKGVALLAFPTKWGIYRPLLMIGYYRWFILIGTLIFGTLLTYYGFIA